MMVNEAINTQPVTQKIININDGLSFAFRSLWLLSNYGKYLVQYSPGLKPITWAIITFEVKAGCQKLDWSMEQTFVSTCLIYVHELHPFDNDTIYRIKEDWGVLPGVNTYPNINVPKNNRLCSLLHWSVW